MVHTESAPHPARASGTSWWQSILLGIVLIVTGLFVLRDAVAATVVSVIEVGVALLAAGLFEATQSFWAPHWGGVLWRLAVGALYAIGGGVLIADPLAASAVVTLAFAAALVASGALALGCRQPGRTRAESHPLHAAILSLGTEDNLRRSYLRKCWQGRLWEPNQKETSVSACRFGHSPDSASRHHLTDTTGPTELEPP